MGSAGPARYGGAAAASGKGERMRVARLHAVGDLRISEVPVPAPEPGMSLVRVTAVGICGSDLHWWGEAGIGDATLTHPLILGHEAAGVIAEGPRKGERVAIDPAVPCGACRSCRDGHRNLCSHTKFAGHAGQDGVMRDFMAWPSELLRSLPDALTDAEGSLLEPLGVAIHALDLGHVRLGASVAVVGCGPNGLLLTAVLRAAGGRPGARWCVVGVGRPRPDGVAARGGAAGAGRRLGGALRPAAPPPGGGRPVRC